MKNFIVIVLVFAASANAQLKVSYLNDGSRGLDTGYRMLVAGCPSKEDFRIPYVEMERPAYKLTGVLSQDLFAVQPESPSHKDSLDLLNTRSSLKAGLFSLIVPGAGQIYNGGTVNYITAAGFIAIEAAAIAVNVIWTNKANNKTTYFQNYADGTPAEWSTYGQNGYLPLNSNVHYYNVYKYAQWIYNNYQQLEQQNGTTSDGQTIISQQMGYLFETPTHHSLTFDPTQAPWTQVNWDALNLIEQAMGGYFSHQLPPYGQQQYYELIGKYPEFREGWTDENPVYFTYNQLQPATGLSGYYMDQRGLANNLYGVAGTAIGVLIANHFVSAIEAAIWAHGHNKSIQTSVGVTSVPLYGVVGYQTQLNVAVNF